MRYFLPLLLSPALLAAQYGPPAQVDTVADLLSRNPSAVNPVVETLGRSSVLDGFGTKYFATTNTTTTNLYYVFDSPLRSGWQWRAVNIPGTIIPGAGFSFTGNPTNRLVGTGDLTFNYTVPTNSLGTNQISTAFYNWITSIGGGATLGVNGTNVSDANLLNDLILWSLNGTNITASFTVGNIVAGSGVSISGILTNRLVGSGDIEISATGTNVSTLGVNGATVSNPNLTNGTFVIFSNSGSNITATIPDGSLTTNKINSAFHTLLTSGGGGGSVWINDAEVANPNLEDSSQISLSAAGTNVTFGVVNNSITTNKIDSTFYSLLTAPASSVFIQGTNIPNPNFIPGSGVAFNVASATNITISSSGTVTVSTNNLGYLQRTSDVVTISELDGTAAVYSWTIPMGTLSVDGDAIDIYIPGSLRPYATGPNGLNWNLRSTDNNTTLIQYSTPTNYFDVTSSAWGMETFINLKRGATNLLTATVRQFVGDDPLTSVNAGTPRLVAHSSTSYDHGFNWDDTDLTFEFNAGFPADDRAATLTFRGYTLHKVGSGSSGGGELSDGDKGEIIVSGSGATWTIDNGVITTNKLTTAAYTYIDSHLTAAEGGALFQATNTVLTTTANLTGGTATNFLAGDGTFKQVTTNMIPGLVATLTAPPNIADGSITTNKLAAGVHTWVENHLTQAEAGTLFQATNALHTAFVALGNGMVAKTGAGTLANRTITGDSEIVVSNGDGVSGNPTLSIAASITRDSELASYAPLSSPTLTTPTFNTSITGGTDAFIQLDEHASAPATPASGNVRVYAKADGRVYRKDDTGAEAELGGGGSGGGTKTIAVLIPGDHYPTATDYAGWWTRNSIAVLEFDDANTEYADWVGVIPEAAVLTSGITVNVPVMGKTATSGNIRICGQFERMNTDSDADSFDTATCVTVATSGTSGIPVVASFTSTNIDGLTAGDPFRFRLYRDSENTGEDTMTADAQVTVVELRTAN